MSRALIVPPLAAALLTAACAQLPLSSPQPAPAPGLPAHIEIAPEQAPIDTPQSQLMYHLMAGELAAGRGMAAAAARHFMAALRLRPDAELAARTTALSLAADDLDMAVEAAERWQKIDPSELSPNEVLARLYLRQNRTQDVLRVSRPLIDAHPAGRSEGFRALGLLLSQEPQHAEAALQVLEALSEENPDDAGAWYALGLTAVRYGELGLAEQAARRALELGSEDEQASLLLAGVQVRQGELEQAEATLAAALRENPGESELRVGFAKLLLESGHAQRARTQLQQALQAEPGNVDARYALALIELEDRNLGPARGHLQRLYDDGQRRDEAAYYLGRIAEVERRPEDALQWYGRVQGGTQALDAVLRTAAVEASLGRIAQARGQLERLRRAYPQLGARLYVAEGEILYTAQRGSEALEVYNEALDQYPEDPDLLYGRSLVYEQLGQLDRAEADLRTLIERDPEDARALNALGYMLTTHTQRYQEALDLIRRAIELSPEDPAVIDSLGWVHYRLGDLDEAHDHLQRAFDRLQDPEIAAHLGEVLWQMGRRDEARDVWETALREDPDHPVLRETVARYVR